MEEKLPEGWVLAKVNEIADVIEPGFPHGRYNTEGIGIPHLRPMNIDRQGQLSLDEVKYVNVHNPPLLHTGDILFNNTNSPVWVGKTTVINQGEQYTFSNHMTRVTLNPHAGSSPFFALQFQYMQHLGYFLERCIHHVNQASIASSYLAKNVEISVAPVPEQHRIVAAIEQQFTRLDNAVASLKSAQAKTKQYRASLLKAAVEGELTKEWRTEHPASETGTQLLTRILKERRVHWEEEQLAKMREKGITPKDDKWKQGYKEPQKPDVENLPMLPEGWCWTTLESIAHIQLGKMLSPKAYEMHLVQLDYLRNDNIRWGYIDYSDIKKMGFKEGELEKYSLLPNDLLVCEGGEPGRCAVYKGNIEYIGNKKKLMYQKALHRVRMIENIVSSYFIQLCLQHYVASKIIIPKFSETTIQHLPLEKISVLPFPLPPVAEQEQIVAEVETRLSNIAKLEEATENNLKRAEHERQSILQEAFAGRLVPQDPEDEPASVLLERIREERRKRDEAAKVLRVDRKGAKMDIAKRRRASKAGAGRQAVGLYEKLVEAGQPLSPDELFKRVELKTDEQPESVEVFYEELDTDVEDQVIAEIRPDDVYVLLEALEPSAEVLAHVEEEKVAVQLEKVGQGKKKVEQPTLWDV